MHLPRLTRQTAAASLAQFITIMILGIPANVYTIISSCHSDGQDCVSNAMVTIVFYILSAGWFGIIVLLGYAAQKRRSRQFAVLLAGFEFITLVVAGYIDYPHDDNILAKITSLIDALISLWVIYLAVRLFLSGGKRIVNKPLAARVRKKR